MKIFSGNQLKIIALIAMTCDHVGLSLFPQYDVFRIIGRLAFPLFAYMIAEGCRHTRNRQAYLRNILGLGILCQVVYLIAERSLYQCILITFGLSICFVYTIDYAKKRKTAGSMVVATVVGLGVWFLSVPLPELLKIATDYKIDYGFWGILLPVVIYFAPHTYKVPATAMGLLPLCISFGSEQWYCYIAVLLLLFYNGTRGKANMKNLFYIYYPVHLVCIYLLGLLI